MDLTIVKAGFDCYLKEFEKRSEIIRALMHKQDYKNLQIEYIDLYEKTNQELYKIVDQIQFEDFVSYLQNMQPSKECANFAEFLLLILSYISISKGVKDEQKFDEHELMTYYDLGKWYAENKNIDEASIEATQGDIDNASKSSIAVRNIIANREDLNVIFDIPTKINDVEKISLSKIISAKLDILINITNISIILNGAVGSFKSIPKPILLKYVLLDILSKEYQLDFSVEDYLTRYYDTRDILKETFNINAYYDKDVIKQMIQRVVKEINDTTFEYATYKQKGKTI